MAQQNRRKNPQILISPFARRGVGARTGASRSSCVSALQLLRCRSCAACASIPACGAIRNFPRAGANHDQFVASAASDRAIDASRSALAGSPARGFLWDARVINFVFRDGPVFWSDAPMDGSQTLGQRIVEAARLMVAAHLHASLDGVSNFRQQVVIGGAGPSVARDDSSSRGPGDSFTDEALPNITTGGTRSPVAPADGGAE
jgi:hypothetical protein